MSIIIANQSFIFYEKKEKPLKTDAYGYFSISGIRVNYSNIHALLQTSEVTSSLQLSN